MIEFLQAHPEIWAYMAIPIISAIVGWGTNVLALKMTFFPLEFVGIPPYLGWQGIIPAKAGAMAEKSVDLLTSKLITVEERFSYIDPEEVARQMEPELERISRRVINESMEAQAPLLWLAVPPTQREKLYERVRAELPGIVISMTSEIKEHIDELFDLKGMVRKILVRDKALLNEIFLRVGSKEFRFIERSGLYFGFLFGLIQMVIWYFYKPWWFLPAAGLAVGYATNWLALKLIFFPQKAWRIGPFVFQGLFIKRQKAVAAEYATIVAEQIMTSRNIFESILHGKTSHKLMEMVREHVAQTVDSTAGSSKQWIKLLAGTKKYEVIKNIATSGVIEDLRVAIAQIYDYTEDALDMKETMEERMAQLPPDEFAGFLRPVFQEDELKLILVGAFLGMLAGLAQWYILF